MDKDDQLAVYDSATQILAALIVAAGKQFTVSGLAEARKLALDEALRLFREADVRTT